MTFKTLDDFDLHDKRVILRADLNVPRQDGKVTDTTRIDRLKPTIDHLQKSGAKTIILSHFGRPDGEHNPQMSLAFLVNILSKQWNTPVSFAQDSVGEKAENAVNAMNNGDVLLLENVRFHTGEKANDNELAQAFASLGDIYVNDAFSAAHRAHASTVGVANHIPAAAGMLMAEELNALKVALGFPKKPVAAIVGGSKISTKLSVLNNLIKKVDLLVLGGGMANTFLYAHGAGIGASLCEKDMADEARAIMNEAEDNNCKIILPIDVVTVTGLSPDADTEIHISQRIPEDRMAVDIGPQSIKHIADTLKTCKTVLWNGPMGVFEIPPFDTGTNQVAQIVASLTQDGTLQSIAGGGDTVSALENAQAACNFTYISTAGGAFLEWLEGKELPGVQALKTA